MASGAAWADETVRLVRTALEGLPDQGGPPGPDDPYDQDGLRDKDDLREVLAGLAAGLTRARGNPLLKQFAVHKFTPVPAVPTGPELAATPGRDTLTAAERRAVQVSCGPGIQAVVVPAGQQRSKVVAVAIAQLTHGQLTHGQLTHGQLGDAQLADTDAGRRVLVVSPTDLGLTAATGDVVTAGEGRMVTVADSRPPGSTEEMDLDRLTEARERACDQRAGELSAALEQLAQADAQLAEVEAELAGFDAEAYRLADRRVANREGYDGRQRQLGPAGIELNEASAAEAQSRKVLVALAFREAELEEAKIGARLASVDAELGAPAERSWRRRLGRRGTVRKLRATRSELVRQLLRAGTELRRTLGDARRQHVDPGLVGVLSRYDVEAAHESATRRLDEATAHLTRLRREADRLKRAGLSEPEDQPLVSGGRRLWELHESLPGLRDRSARAVLERAELSREREQVLARRSHQRAEVIATARVLATTLDRLALDPSLTAAPFDHVIIVDASAVHVPHLAHAVGQGRIGAVLVGDLRADGAPGPDGLPGTAGPDDLTGLGRRDAAVIPAGLRNADKVRKLFRQNGFEFFGMTDRVKAGTIAGCVVLTGDDAASQPEPGDSPD